MSGGGCLSGRVGVRPHPEGTKWSVRGELNLAAHGEVYRGAGGWPIDASIEMGDAGMVFCMGYLVAGFSDFSDWRTEGYSVYAKGFSRSVSGIDLKSDWRFFQLSDG